MTTNYGSNPQIPGISTDAYIPDQLIAGNLKLVTKSVTIASSAALVRGAVLGQITEGAVAVTPGANTGNGTVNSITRGNSAKAGNYTLTATGSAAFNITDPNGDALPAVTLDVAYTDAQINFTVAHGSTPFIAGDKFTLAIPAGSGKFITSVKTAVDGSQNPCAILVDNADASGGDVVAGIYVMGEFNSNALTMDASWTADTLEPILRAAGIFLKGAVGASDPS